MPGIAIVADRPADRATWAALLAARGYDVRDAAGAAAADLVLAVGADAARRVRGDPALAGVPVVAAGGDPDAVAATAAAVARLAADGRRHADRLAAAADLADRLATENDPERLLAAFADGVRAAVGAEGVVVAVGKTADPPYRVVLARGPAADPFDPAAPLTGTLAAAAAAGQSVRVAGPADWAAVGWPAAPPPAALMLVPIRSPARVHGWACLLDPPGGGEFTADDERLARPLAALAGRVYEGGRLYADVLAHTTKLATEAAERMRAEAEVRTAAELLRAVVEGATDAVFVKDAESRYLLVNEAVARFFGKSVADILNRDDTALFDPATARLVMAGDQRVMAAGRAETEEQSFPHDGTTLTFQTTKAPYRDAAGRVVGVVGIARDVTAYKQAERRAATQYAVVSILSETADLPAAAPALLAAIGAGTGWDAAGLWVVAPAAAGEALGCVALWHDAGFDAAAFEAHSRELTFAPGVGLPGRVWAAGQARWVEDVAAEPTFLRAATAAAVGLRGGFAFPIRLGDRVLGVVECYSRHSRRPDADLVRMFESLGRQIGQFVERERVKAGLRLFRTLVDRTLDAVEVIDPDTGRFLDVNERACVLHGYARAEYLALAVPDVNTQVARPWADLIAERRRAGALVYESERRRKDGTTFPVEVSEAVIRLEREYLVAVVRDITDRKRLEEQFLQSQKMEAVGRLAGGVAHDFNNLLTVINGFGELALDRLAADAATRQLIEAVVTAGQRAAGLTRQLLAFSRKAVVAPRLLDLGDVVARVEALVRRIVGEDVQLTIARDPDLWTVRADPGQVEQVLMNLVVNARDAMPTGGRIAVRVENVALDAAAVRDRPDARPGPHVALSVADTGCGMDAATKARIFEPFFTTKGDRGTGLGLATVHGIVRQFGGHVVVESEVGRGTTFRVFFPYRTTRDEPGDFVNTTRPTDGRGTETILLVEDEDAVRALTLYVLRMQGYAVIEASDGPQAVQKAAEHGGPIDLLVTDVVMPRMGGREVAQAIGRDRPGLKTLFLSGYTDDLVVRHGVQEAEVAFLQKPFTPAGLAAKVREVLDAGAKK